ncbi:MAG TPA: DUF3089 domain-containing protein, partial [Thermoleophilaceae bacterium]
GSTRIERAKRARKAPIDCFYVYPTVSGQPTVNATRTIDPEQRDVAQAQVARFSQVCRVWAPIYRQVTLAGITNPTAVPLSAQLTAYGDVASAWTDYLYNHTHGRGVVLIGHSQGALVLKKLLQTQIENRRAVRRRVVSSLLIGGNVTVRKGRNVGGDFKHVPACRRARDIRCVIAYSTFNTPPPANSLFGRVGGGIGTSGDPARLEVLCTNPAALAGGSGALRPYFPTKRLSGPLGLVTPPQLVAPTPFATFPGLYRGRCLSQDGANWLQVDDVGGAGDVRTRVAPLAGPVWGLHTADVSLALGNLVDVVRRQAKVYARMTSSTKASLSTTGALSTKG